MPRPELDTTSELRAGDRVTFLPILHKDPIHLEMQRHVIVAQVLAKDQYTIKHSGLMNFKLWGPYERRRLARGWVDYT